MQEVGNVQSGDSARIQSAASREQSDNGQLRYDTGVAHAKVTSSPDTTQARKPEFPAEDIPADFNSRKLKDALSPSLADWLSEPGKVDSSAPKMPIVSEDKPEKGESRESVATQAVDRIASEITSDRPTSLQAQANVTQVAALHLLSVETPAEASQEPDQKQHTSFDASHGQNASDVDPVQARKPEFPAEDVPADISSMKLKDAPRTSFVDWFSEHSKTGSNAPKISIVSEGKPEKGMSGEIVAAQTVGRMASEIASNRPKSLLLQANVTEGEALHLLTMGEMAEASQEPDQKQHTSFDASHGQEASDVDPVQARKPEFKAEDVPVDISSMKLKDALSPSLTDWLSEPGKVDSSAPKMPIVSEGNPEEGESRESVATQAVDRIASEITSDRPTSLQAQANVAQGAALHLLSVETPAEASQEPDQKQYMLSDAPHEQNASDVDPVRARKTGFGEDAPAERSSEKLKDAPLTSFVDWFSEHSKTESSAPKISIVSEGKPEKGMSGEIVAAQTVGRMASEIASNRPKSLQLQANVTQGEALHLLTMGEMAEATQGPDEKQHTSFDASHGQDASNVGPVRVRKPEFPEEDIPADSSSEKLKDALLTSFVDWLSEHSKTGSDVPEISASAEGKPESGASWEIVAAQAAGRVASEIASNRPMSLIAQANVTQDAALHLLSMGALAETIQEPGQKPHTLFDADYMDVRTKVAKMPHEPR